MVRETMTKISTRRPGFHIYTRRLYYAALDFHFWSVANGGSVSERAKVEFVGHLHIDRLARTACCFERKMRLCTNEEPVEVKSSYPHF